MTRTAAIAVTVLMTALVAVFGVTVIDAKSSRQPTGATTSGLIDVMQMMRNAKDLPAESYDAH